MLNVFFLRKLLTLLTCGFICDAKASINSGIKSSANRLHSFFTTLSGIKSHEPSKTSLISS